MGSPARGAPSAPLGLQRCFNLPGAAGLHAALLFAVVDSADVLLPVLQVEIMPGWYFQPLSPLLLTLAAALLAWYPSAWWLCAGTPRQFCRQSPWLSALQHLAAADLSC